MYFRRLIFLFLINGFLLPLQASAQEARPAQNEATPVLQTFFANIEEGKKALTEGTEKSYFDSLHLAEMRAKTGLELKDTSLEQAREKTRQFYADQVQQFTKSERTALEGVLARLQPALESQIPMYARSRWEFVKIGNAIEGGMPHTRGNSIVLSSRLVRSIAKYHEAGQFKQLDAFAADLLVHEQTHVLQRRHPALFASLFSTVFGFKRLVPAPNTTWLLERNVVNPDAPVCDWAFPIVDGDQTRWIIPMILLRETEQPRMPKDFQMVGVSVEQKNGLWTIVETDKEPNRALLENVPQYVQAFPNPQEFYHPHEIAADLIAAWISGSGDGDMTHPLRAKTVKWALKNLR